MEIVGRGHWNHRSLGTQPKALRLFNSLRELRLAPRARFELATLRLTAEVVEILNALSCVAYRETRPIFSPSVGLLGLPAIDSVTPADQARLGSDQKQELLRRSDAMPSTASETPQPPNPSGQPNPAKIGFLASNAKPRPWAQ